MLLAGVWSRCHPPVGRWGGGAVSAGALSSLVPGGFPQTVALNLGGLRPLGTWLDRRASKHHVACAFPQAGSAEPAFPTIPRNKG